MELRLLAFFIDMLFYRSISYFSIYYVMTKRVTTVPTLPTCVFTKHRHVQILISLCAHPLSSLYTKLKLDRMENIKIQFLFPLLRANILYRLKNKLLLNFFFLQLRQLIISIKFNYKKSIFNRRTFKPQPGALYLYARRAIFPNFIYFTTREYL